MCSMRLCTTATLLASSGKAWIIDKGPCVSDSFGCVMSPNFPGNYSNGQNCQMSGSPGCSMDVKHFNTESNADFLCVQAGSGSTCYSGSALPSNIVPGSFFTWRTDGKGTASGWKLCPTGHGCTLSNGEDHAQTNPSTGISHAMRDLKSNIAAAAVAVRIYGLVLCVCVAVLALSTVSWLLGDAPQAISVQVPLLGDSQHGPTTPSHSPRKAAAAQTPRKESAAQTCAACAECRQQQQQSWPPHLEARLANLERKLFRWNDFTLGRQLLPPGKLFDLTHDDSSAASCCETGSSSSWLVN